MSDFKAKNAPKSIGWGSAPDPLAVFKGPTSKGKKGEGREEGRQRGGEGREERHTNSWLRHCGDYIVGHINGQFRQLGNHHTGLQKNSNEVGKG